LQEARSPQLKRYRAALPNLILTDYLEFRWYVGGERRAKVALGHLGPGGKVKAGKEDVAAVGELLAQFLAHRVPTIGRAEDLAGRMAGLAHLMRDAALNTLEAEPETGTLTGWRPPLKRPCSPTCRGRNLPTCMPRPSPTDCSPPR
jgi:hypothetical protein